jgi:DNA polymerase-2
MFSGWLFDAYAKNDKMVFWIRQSNGKTIKLEDDWSHPIYVATDDKSLFEQILASEDIGKHILNSEIVLKYENLTDSVESPVLQLGLTDSNSAARVASKIEKKFRFGEIRLYNVDVLPAQTYFYEHGIFPTCYCHINEKKSGLDWDVRDSVWSTDYELPQFNNVYLKVFPKVAQGTIPRYTDGIDYIEIQKYYDNETIRIEEDSESDILYKLMRQMANLNADFVLTDDGDSFTFPYLIERANSNSIKLELGRESSELIKPAREGTSYFSYGKIFFKPSTIKLLGRIHIDTDNSFIMAESGLPGLYELARICRMPFHTASRASIGKCMSSLQFYTADRNNVLIPWKPTLAEHVKNLEELLIADRGGMILEPWIGVHENIAELDFVSLYPSIMEKKNISAETIFCNCCPDSSLGVPGLDNYYRCEKRKGLVPTALEILLAKRKIYKKLRNSATDTELKAIYDARQTAIKWVLVTSFGYLGFNNAKFGRIDAHIAVCAFDRKILIDTIRTAEQQGFKVLHAIVDSIWVRKNNLQKDITIDTDVYESLKEAIENKTGFDISVEGVYKWVAFVPSKSNNTVGVPNRYFGVFEDGTLKLRGIEARRHDTPVFFSNYQQLILNVLSEADSISEVKAMFPKIENIFNSHLKLLKERKVSLTDLVFTKRVSKNYDEYEYRNTVENSALLDLSRGGKSLRAGEILKYVITDHYGKHSKKRSVPIELANSQTKFDVKRYCEILQEVTNTVTEPFGIKLKDQNAIRL